MTLEEIRRELNNKLLVEYKYPVGFKFWRMAENKPIEVTITDVVIRVNTPCIKYVTDKFSDIENNLPDYYYLTK